MNVACCTWALSGAEKDVLHQVADIGFDWIDIRPGDFVDADSQTELGNLNLRVSCMAVSFGIPADIQLDSDAPGEAARGVEIATAALARAAHVGASAAYVVPGMDGSTTTLNRYGDVLSELADRAADLGIKLCVEHFPGRALPTIAGTLAYLRAVGHPNLHLLLDIGHAMMTDENIPAAIADAGDRLGYVHLDDNDGKNDLHWALLDGVLTDAIMRDTFVALAESEYAGPVSLELSPQLPDPLDALRRSWDVVQAHL